MRIGDLAARTGVSVRSLRYYEEQGLLTSTRSAGGQRHYAEEAVGRVLYLQRLYAAGLSSQTIAATLPCVESPSDANSDAAFARLIEERDKLTTHIAELSRTRDSLDELIAANRRHRAATAQQSDSPDGAAARAGRGGGAGAASVAAGRSGGPSVDAGCSGRTEGAPAERAAVAGAMSARH